MRCIVNSQTDDHSNSKLFSTQAFLLGHDHTKENQHKKELMSEALEVCELRKQRYKSFFTDLNLRERLHAIRDTDRVP
jgi:hypothetical protein